ncbi:hypothetical protein [Spirulina sp. 06S082]|uniref:hypothetical protein n=1 Tax=Spirulina sp. 06S082 TaxID=3110248 RepID=UPI002B1FCEF9|nr:hypothetical protein [Spirulina sp. 06S082]
MPTINPSHLLKATSLSIGLLSGHALVSESARGELPPIVTTSVANLSTSTTIDITAIAPTVTNMSFPETEVTITGLEERGDRELISQQNQTTIPTAENLDLDPQIIEESPVLQRWLEEIPDVLEEIRNDPVFRSRIRLGYSHFPSTNHQGGWNIGIEDVFLGETGLTVSGEYQGTFSGDRETWGGDFRYYILPLGSAFNIAPVVGYRNITTNNFQTDGLNIGVKAILASSRGAGDISLSQTFVSPGSSEEVGITTLSIGYALTPQFRLSTDLQKQNSRGEKDSRVGISLEFLL